MSGQHLSQGLTAAAAGLTEAWVYRACGCFASLQGGNLLLALLALTQRDWGMAGRCLLSAAAYCLGVALLCRRGNVGGRRRALPAAVLIVTVLLPPADAAVALSFLWGFLAEDGARRRRVPVQVGLFLLGAVGGGLLVRYAGRWVLLAAAALLAARGLCQKTAASASTPDRTTGF